jgi:type IV fimbrial biogenesis protein FimT
MCDLHATQRIARQCRYVSGFTLVEMMVTVAVVAVLAGVAIPSLRAFVQDERQSTQTQRLWMSLNLARSESRKQDVSISVCASTDGLTCSGSASGWSSGWVVLSTAPGTTKPAMTVPALPNGTTLSEATPVATVTFYSNGMVNAPAAFTFCDSRGAANARSVEVTLAGRVSASTVVGKRLNGAVLACP